MHKKRWLAMLLMAGCGCSSMNNTEKDGLGGAAAGAGLFALATRGNPVATAFGEVFGGVVGAGIGNSQDRVENRDKAIAQAQANAAAYAAANQMKISDVIQMAQRNTPDDVIIRQMDATNSAFNLTTADILDLQNQGVSSRVISAMQARRYPRPVVLGPGPVYGPACGPPPGTVVFVDPGPPPPVVEPVVGVGIGGRWR